VGKIENKKGNESDSVTHLLDILDLKGLVLTLDALHCKKNFGQNRLQGQSLCSQGEGQSTELEKGT
jgi:predicted transposase YbfD/YdcC